MVSRVKVDVVSEIDVELTDVVEADVVNNSVVVANVEDSPIVTVVEITDSIVLSDVDEGSVVEVLSTEADVDSEVVDFVLIDEGFDEV